MLSFAAASGFWWQNLTSRACRNLCSRSQVMRNITPDSKCVGCEGIGEALPPAEVLRQTALLIPDWKVNDDCTRITRSLKAKNFKVALDYITQIGIIAEAEQHHPDLTIRSYNHVDIQLWTHSLGGITENDLILAVKIDTIPVTLAKK